MMLGGKLNLLLLIVCVALVIDCVNGQEDYYCCEFEAEDLCDWENVGEAEFEWTGVTFPDLTNINDFETHPSNSVWFQNNFTGSGDFVSPPVTLNGDDIINVELYIHQIKPNGGYPLTVYFDDILNRSTVLIISRRSGWNQPLSAYCGGSNLCCLDYPCTGNIRVHAEVSDSGDLLAFDNIQVNGCPPTTTTSTTTTVVTSPPTSTAEVITTTTPPPSPNPSSFCCSFETGCPTWVITGWTLSSDSLPTWGNITPFTYESQYAWNEDDDAGKIISPVINNVRASSIFRFNYYVHTDELDVTNSVIVYFRETNSSSVTYLAILSDSNGQWLSVSVNCATCCYSFPCDGQVVVESSFGPGENLYAIDNIEINGGCVDSPKCCEFEDQDICGIINADSTHSWKWSGSSSPNMTLIPTFTSDGDYLYYQQYEVSEDDLGSARLQTGLMTVTNSSAFNMSFFVDTEEQFPLTVLFRRYVDGRETVLDFVSDTYDNWATVTVYCVSLHGDCCYPEKKCNGYLEISADLTAPSDSPVFFAVDNIDVDEECEATDDGNFVL